MATEELNRIDKELITINNNVVDLDNKKADLNEVYTKKDVDFKVDNLNNTITSQVTNTVYSKVNSSINSQEYINKLKGANGSNFTWNMLLKSNVVVENDKYNINNYDLSGDFVVGEDYTLTIWGKLGEDRTRFDFYNSESYVRLEGATEISQGVYSVSFKWKDTREYNGVVHKGDNSKLLVYAYPSGGKSTSRIDKIKLEKGINTNPVWSPHISEINGKDGVDGKDGTFEGEIGGRNLIKNSDKIIREKQS